MNEYESQSTNDRYADFQEDLSTSGKDEFEKVSSKIDESVGDQMSLEEREFAEFSRPRRPRRPLMSETVLIHLIGSHFLVVF